MKNKALFRGGLDDALNIDDILGNILTRLPPDTIFKLILVSKRWLHVICSSSFRYSYLGIWEAEYNLLGFFIRPSVCIAKRKEGPRRPRSEAAIEFLSTCEEGDDINFPGILKKLGYFIDSSNGFLLCGRHPKYYFVWNPVTKNPDKIPHPRIYFEEFCMAFMVEEYPDGSFNYKFIRAKCDRKLDEVKAVTIESFSSKTATWSSLVLNCSSTISLCPWTTATVIGGIIHWYAEWGNVAIYDPNHDEKRIDLIKLPGSNDYDENILGVSSDGLLQYGESTKVGMSIWVLQKEVDSDSSRWRLRYRLNFKIMWKKNPSMMSTFHTLSKETQVLSFLPRNSESIFIRCESNIFLYRFKNEKVEVVRYNGRASSISWEFWKVVPYFNPAWPCSSLCSTW